MHLFCFPLDRRDVYLPEYADYTRFAPPCKPRHSPGTRLMLRGKFFRQAQQSGADGFQAGTLGRVLVDHGHDQGVQFRVAARG